MSSTNETKLQAETRATAEAAKAAGGKLARLGGDGRSKLLRALAAALREPGVRAEVFAANAKDLERAKAENVATPLVKRLGLDAGKLDGVCDGLDQLAAMPDLVGRATLRRELDDGLVLERVSAPLGLLGVIFESRPDALVQIVGLAWKSGNAVLLKGGREALGTNRALTAVIHRVLEAAGIDRARRRAAGGPRGRRRGAGSARARRGDRRARLVGVRAPHHVAERDPRDGPRRRRLPPVRARGRRSRDGGEAGGRRQDAPTRPRATRPRRCCGTRTRARRWTRARRR